MGSPLPMIYSDLYYANREQTTDQLDFEILDGLTLRE
jgi:hypothetical protein